MGLSGWLGGRMRRRAALQWQRLGAGVRAGQQCPSPRLRDEARALARHLSLFVQASDAALAAPGSSVGLLSFPPGTDWRWRPMIFGGMMQPRGMVAPENGQRLGDEVALWHDCPHRALILQQRANRRATDLAPYGLQLEALGFAGSYLSLSLELPPEARAGLSKHHILRLDATLESERPITVYGRLNVAQGPNTETILRQLGDPVPGRGSGRGLGRVVEFDLGYTQLNQRAVDKLWLDLIFEAPHMNAVTLSDLILSRHSRADL